MDGYMRNFFFSVLCVAYSYFMFRQVFAKSMVNNENKTVKEKILSEIINLTALLVKNIIHFGISCMWIFFITRCLGLGFNIRFALGIWLIIEFIRYNMRIDVS